MRRILYAASCAALLSGCSSVKDMFSSKDETPLPGTRVSVLELQKQIEPDSAELNAQGFIAPEAWRNDYWPQAGGYPNHAMQHLALNPDSLKKVWAVDIGAGSTKELPLTAQPIIADGRVFALDSESKLVAMSAADGKVLWRYDVSNPKEDDAVISGGLAYSQGVLFATTGYDEVIALRPEDGAQIWRVHVPSPVRAAPTVMESRLFVTTLDNRIIALDAATGQVLWDYAGVGETTGLVGAASPAADREVVVPAFSSGEIFALRVENGAMAWAENLGALTSGGGLGSLTDIRGLPVIDKGIVVAVSFGGRMVAIDERTGARVWQREIGGSETPWVAGNHLFVISSNNEVVALGRDNGVISWVTKLARYEDPGDRKGPIFWTGPVMAGGRLIVAGSTGEVVEIAPQDGKIVRTWDAGQPVSIPPVVAGETLYLLGENGELMAFR